MSAVQLGQAYPIRANIPGLRMVCGKWTGGGAAAAMAVASGDWNDGIASVAYNAATGKYLVTFQEVGQQIVHMDVKVHRPTSGDDPLPVNVLLTSFDHSEMTVQIEVGATLTDVDTDEKVTFFVVFANVKPNS